jgi:hypothetical protein
MAKGCFRGVARSLYAIVSNVCGFIVTRLSRGLVLLPRDPVYRERCAGQRSVNPSPLHTGLPPSHSPSSLVSGSHIDRPSSVSLGITGSILSHDLIPFTVSGGVTVPVNDGSRMSYVPWLAVCSNILNNAPQRRERWQVQS